MAEIVKMRKTSDLWNIAVIADELEKRIAAETICKETKADDKAIMICLEQFYFRVKNYATLTVWICQENDYQEVVLVGAGGGSGLSNISWGANKSIVKNAKKVLQEMGFVMV